MFPLIQLLAGSLFLILVWIVGPLFSRLWWRFVR